MKDFIVLLSKLSRSRWRAALGLALGAGAGAAYAHFVGCRTGTCPLTSNVWTAALFFGFSGALVGWPAKLPRSPEGENARGRPVAKSP
jgi:hypothetical protein